MGLHSVGRTAVLRTTFSDGSTRATFMEVSLTSMPRYNFLPLINNTYVKFYILKLIKNYEL